VRVSAIPLALLLMGAAPYQVVADGIPTPLDGMAGDAGRGRALMLARTTSTCTLCHTAPLPEERFQGDIGPPLHGVGARLTPAQLRLRLVDASAANPDSIMPRYYATAGLTNVGRAWQGRPVLAAQQIEDLVAYLAGLR